MSRGLRVRIEGPSWQGIPCHDAPVTFGAHVTRVTISVLEQTECGQVVSHVWSRLVAIGLLVFCLGEIVSGCDLVSRTLLTVMQCTIEGSDRSVGTPGSLVLNGRIWGGLFKSEAGRHMGIDRLDLGIIVCGVRAVRVLWPLCAGVNKY